MISKDVPHFTTEIPPFWMIPDGKGTWVIAGDLGFWSAKYQREFVIERGCINNLSSIPSLFQSFVPVNGDNRIAAPHHDRWFELKGDIDGGKITRQQANIMYKEILSMSRAHVLERMSKELINLLNMTKSGQRVIARMAEDKPLVGLVGRNVLYSGLKAGSWVNWQ